MSLKANNETYLKYCFDDIPDIQKVCSETLESGVTCSQNFDVSIVDMSNSGIRGILPVNFGELGPIKQINFGGNHIESPLPNSFSQLTALEVLDLSGNELGTAGVVELDVGRRLMADNISSDLFKTISQLTSLTYLDLSENGLVGEVAESLCDLPLQTLYLMNPTNFSSPETNNLGLEFASEQENNFTCIARCFYQNPNDISLSCDYDQRYCGQTEVPTSAPTFPNLASSSGLINMSSTQMSTLIIGVALLLLVLLCLVYYFCCYSNVSVKDRDEERIHRASFINIDMLKENRRDRHSQREFDSYLNDVNGDSDGGSSYEDGFNYMNPSYRHFHEDNNFSDSDNDDEATRSSNPSNQSSSTGAKHSSKNESEENDALNAWNEDLIDFQKGNAFIPDLPVPEGFFNIEDVTNAAMSDSGSASDDSNPLVPYREKVNLGFVLGDSSDDSNDVNQAEERYHSENDDEETFATLFIHNEAQPRMRVPVIYEQDGSEDGSEDEGRFEDSSEDESSYGSSSFEGD